MSGKLTALHEPSYCVRTSHPITQDPTRICRVFCPQLIRNQLYQDHSGEPFGGKIGLLSDELYDANALMLPPGESEWNSS